MTPLTPANLAAIERRAAAATEARAALRARLDAPRSVFDVPVAEAQMRDMAERDCAADVPALLRHITALQAQHAGEVAEYADALERSRSSIAQACDEAVRAERSRCVAVCRDIASRSGDAGEADECADAIAATTGGAP